MRRRPQVPADNAPAPKVLHACQPGAYLSTLVDNPPITLMMVADHHFAGFNRAVVDREVRQEPPCPYVLPVA